MTRWLLFLLLLAPSALAAERGVVTRLPDRTHWLTCPEGSREVGSHNLLGPHCVSDSKRLLPTYGGDWGLSHRRARWFAHAANLGDYASTRYALSRGAREGNPVVRALTPEGALVVSTVLTEYLYRQLATRSLYTLATFKGVVVLWNLDVARDQK